MARPHQGRGKLQPYTFTPTPPILNALDSPLITLARTAVPNGPIHTNAFLERDPEILRAAQILINIYHKEASSIAAREARESAIERPTAYAQDVDMFDAALAPSEHDEDGDEDLEMLVSPAKQVEERLTKRRTTRGKAVIKKPTQKRAQTAKKPSKSPVKDTEYFENPVLTAIHNSPAKKKSRRKSSTIDQDNDDGDTTEIDSASSGNEDANDNDIVNKPSPGAHRRPGLDDGKRYSIDQRRTKPSGYITPLSPTPSPISPSLTSSQRTTILASESPTKTLPHTPSPTKITKTEPSSVTSLQKFITEARRSQAHRRTESLESSGFFEKVRRAHQALGDESGEDEDEEEGENMEVEVSRLADEGNEEGFVKEEDGDVEMTLGNEVVGDSDDREEGEISEDELAAPPLPPQRPRARRDGRFRGPGGFMILDY
ncbi:hypothetical protein PMZ80_000916 [Knufia obscura]|uniref:Uncharacterized protein n=2 Tax=Knufia TaxID=430999 RepID=A0AAN8EBQ6_9EURO|nr:hypothetical protein PMZ80_000916 [Knufia obscura]KAK5950290.1 hypothetical protein OHC33_008759 [Knufia fluminis]